MDVLDSETIGACTLVLAPFDAYPVRVPVAAVIMDPPYGNATTLNRSQRGEWKRVGIENDDDLTARDKALRHYAGVPFASFCSITRAPAPGTRYRLVWNKGGHTGTGDLSFPWKQCAELIDIGGPGWQLPRRTSNVLHYMAITNADRHHPFEKPLALITHLVSAAPPGLIVDPFMGSGTTALACHDLGRPFIGIEMTRRHFDTACARLHRHTSQLRLFI